MSEYKEGDRVRLIDAPSVIGVVMQVYTPGALYNDVNVRWLFTGRGVASNDTRKSCIEHAPPATLMPKLRVGDRYTVDDERDAQYICSSSEHVIAILSTTIFSKLERIGANGWEVIWEKQ